MPHLPPIPTALDAYQELEDLNVDVISAHFLQQKALARNDGLLAIDYRKLSGAAEELELLLHEIGHFSQGAFYTQNSGSIQRARAEARATRHVFEHYYPPQLLAGLMRQGDTEPWQLADCLGLPESFIREMLCFYTEIRRIDFSALAQEPISAPPTSVPTLPPPPSPMAAGFLPKRQTATPCSFCCPHLPPNKPLLRPFSFFSLICNA